jgi:hypothetical protein
MRYRPKRMILGIVLMVAAEFLLDDIAAPASL